MTTKSSLSCLSHVSSSLLRMFHLTASTGTLQVHFGRLNMKAGTLFIACESGFSLHSNDNKPWRRDTFWTCLISPLKHPCKTDLTSRHTTTDIPRIYSLNPPIPLLLPSFLPSLLHRFFCKHSFQCFSSNAALHTKDGFHPQVKAACRVQRTDARRWDPATSCTATVSLLSHCRVSWRFISHTFPPVDSKDKTDHMTLTWYRILKYILLTSWKCVQFYFDIKWQRKKTNYLNNPKSNYNNKKKKKMIRVWMHSEHLNDACDSNASVNLKQGTRCFDGE